MHELTIKVQFASPLNLQKIENLVNRDPARPVKKTAVGVELFHFLPQNNAGLLKHIFDIRRIDQLLGDECIKPMTMLHQQRDKSLARGIIA